VRRQPPTVGAAWPVIPFGDPRASMESRRGQALVVVGRGIAAQGPDIRGSVSGDAAQHPTPTPTNLEPRTISANTHYHF
jgi:hypothetical protein